MKNGIVLMGFIALLLFSMGCQKDFEFEDLPLCIQNELELSNYIYCPDANILRYEFQGEQVYIFNFSSCIADGDTRVMDETCNEVCTFGGLAGATLCNGEDFYETAINETVVWEFH